MQEMIYSAIPAPPHVLIHDMQSPFSFPSFQEGRIFLAPSPVHFLDIHCRDFLLPSRIRGKWYKKVPKIKAAKIKWDKTIESIILSRMECPNFLVIFLPLFAEKQFSLQSRPSLLLLCLEFSGAFRKQVLNQTHKELLAQILRSFINAKLGRKVAFKNSIAQVRRTHDILRHVWGFSVGWASKLSKGEWVWKHEN